MRTYRATYKDRNGQRRQSKRWYLEFRHDGRVCRLPAFASKVATAELARRIEALQALAAVHARPDADLARFLERLPASSRARLVGFGLIEASSAAASRPLADHLRDFEAALRARGNTDTHAALTSKRVRRVFELCGFKFWSDLSASKAEQAIADLRADRIVGDETIQGLGAQSANHYLGALRQFARWMVRDGRAIENPLAHLRTLNARTDRRHQRRALDVEDLCRLIEAAEHGADFHRIPGPERAMLYRVAAETGLRSRELRSLTRSSFELDADDPTVTVQAAYSKRRREDTLPIRMELATALRTFLATKAPAAPAFAMPGRGHVAEMVRADLAAARARWIREAPDRTACRERVKSDRLKYRDAAGRVFDFHALRGQFVSMLAAAGVHPKTAQSLARHSTITLTMDRYTHNLRGAEANAIAALPDLSGRLRDTARATGTDGDARTIEGDLSWRAAERASADVRVYSVDADGQSEHTAHRAQPLVSATKTPANTGVAPKAAVGFEPTNNGFAIRPLGPLGYAAAPGVLWADPGWG